MHIQKKKLKIIVGMSGGVDSSVAAALLEKQGHQAVGVFLRFWKEKNKDKTESKALQDARRISKKLGIPLKIVDARKEFRKKIAEHFLKAYQNGLTPNPCVICNREVKFRILLKMVKKLGVDFVATGHYARKREIRIKNSRFKNREKLLYKLFQAKDKRKDQSYFLYRLTQDQLSRIIFPLGDYTKSEVRKLAKKFKLPVFDKKDSQNICFVKDGDTARFLRENLRLKKGSILSEEGKILGVHQGLSLYTLGQRKGIKIGGTGPYYVSRKNFSRNELVVTNNRKNKELNKKRIIIKKVNWISEKPKFPAGFLVKTRYQQKGQCGIIKMRKKKYLIEFENPQWAVTPGQSAVLYARNGEVVGGGIIA